MSGLIVSFGQDAKSGIRQDFGQHTARSILDTRTKMKKTPQGSEASRLCKEFPNTPTRTLSKRLASDFQITLEQARNLIRYTRGNRGDEYRKFATAPRENGKAGYKPDMPPSIAEPWLPFDLGSDIEVLVLSDAHIPYHSAMALGTSVKYGKKRKPDVILLNGDWVDNYSISRHQKNPAKRDFKQETTAAKDGLSWIRGQFPKARIVLKAGNHEERWQHWLWNNAPEICDFERMSLAQWIDADKYGVEVVTDQRPILAGKLPIMHGHEIGKGISAPVNAARGLFMRTMSTMLIGHGHRTSQHVEPDWWHIDTSCWSSGCLCDLNPQYAVVNKWNFGFVYVSVDHFREFHVDNLRISSDGKVW